MCYVWLPVLGLLIGAVSGLTGVGGGILLIPTLVYLCGMNQHQAVGMALAAMIPPVTLAATAEYYRRGHIDLRLAIVLSISLALGSWASAHFAYLIPELWLRRFFGVLLFLVSLQFLFRR